MVDLSRRDTIKLIGASAAIPTGALAAPVTNVELEALRDRVQAEVDKFSAEPIFAEAQYAKIYDHRVARSGHCKDCDARLEDGIEVVYTRLGHRVVTSQRFVYCVKHDTIELGFAVLPHQTHNFESDTQMMLQKLADSFLQYDEIAAAAPFNAPRTYNAARCGNGQPLCSRHHPHDFGVWSNQLHTDSDLTGEALEAALQQIRADLVDQGGIRIAAHGRMLVVPVALEPFAMRAVKRIDPERFPQFKGYMVWDYLLDQQNWFVLTSIASLVHSDREPFNIRVEIDQDKKHVAVIGRSKRGFGCTDQRSVLASLPSQTEHVL